MMAALFPQTIAVQKCSSINAISDNGLYGAVVPSQSMRRQQKTGFNSPCKLLERRWGDERLEKHRRKLEVVTSTVDSRAPRDYFHLHVKLKQLWMEEQRNADIRRENARLLDRMDVIMRKGGWTESWNNYESRSLNADKRRRDMVEVMKENQRLLQKITQQTPVTISQEWRHYLQPAPRAGSSTTPTSPYLPHKRSSSSSRNAHTSDGKIKIRDRGCISLDSSMNLRSTITEPKLPKNDGRDKFPLLLPTHSPVADDRSAISRRQKEAGIRPEIIISQPVEQER